MDDIFGEQDDYVKTFELKTLTSGEDKKFLYVLVGGYVLCYNKDRGERRENMFYKKVTSRDHKWFFLLRYGDLKEGLEMWSSRSLKLAVF